MAIYKTHRERARERERERERQERERESNIFITDTHINTRNHSCDLSKWMISK